MKKYFLIFMISIGVQASAQESPVDYMSRLGMEYQKIQNDTWDYIKASAHGRNARKVERRRKELVATIRKANYNIRQAGTYKGDASLRDACVDYLTLSELILSEDYGKIVDLEQIAEESYDAMEAYLRAKKEAGTKLGRASAVLDSAQKIFCARYHINLVDRPDKQSKKLEQASKVIDYYNKMYLVFFKSYKQEAYVMNDIRNNNVGAFEQNNNALHTFSTDGLKKMDEIGSFHGDPTLKLSGKKMMSFYQRESAEHFKNFSKLMVLSERVQKISKYIEAKKPSKRTQEEIDRYNATLKEYNDQVNLVNGLNETLNKKRATLLEEWNADAQRFFAKHVPK